MRRIVEETLADGTKQYRVEINTIFLGWIKTSWHTDKVYNFEGYSREAVFDSLEKAETLVYGKPKSKRIVNREIL